MKSIWRAQNARARSKNKVDNAASNVDASSMTSIIRPEGRMKAANLLRRLRCDPDMPLSLKLDVVVGISQFPYRIRKMSPYARED